MLPAIYTFFGVLLAGYLTAKCGQIGEFFAPFIMLALAAAIISGQIASLKKTLLSSNEKNEEESEESDNKETDKE